MKQQSQNKKRNYKIQKIGESLKTVNQRILYKFGKFDYIIHAKWAEIVGVYFVQHSEPKKITTIPTNSLENNHKSKLKRILHVNVTSAAAIEFQHFQNKIIEKINSFFGYQAIDNIKIYQKLVIKNIPPTTKKNNKKNVDLNSKKIEIKDTTHKINDKELGQSLLNLGISISNNEEN